MGKRTTRKSSATDSLLSPPAKKMAAAADRSPGESPTTFKFDFSCFNKATTSSSSPRKRNGKSSAAEPPIATSPKPALSSLTNGPSSIADLKEMTSSRLDSIKRHLDRSHSEILKDMEASHSRLQKRFKIQSQASQQTVDEAENEFKKMTDRLNETHDELKASYTELIAEAQASVTRVCKTTIPELSQSVEKAIDALRTRYGVASTSS